MRWTHLIDPVVSEIHPKNSFLKEKKFCWMKIQKENKTQLVIFSIWFGEFLVCYFVFNIFILFYFQAKGAPHPQRTCRICGEAQGSWHRDHSTTLHGLRERKERREKRKDEIESCVLAFLFRSSLFFLISDFAEDNDERARGIIIQPDEIGYWQSLVGKIVHRTRTY